MTTPSLRGSTAPLPGRPDGTPFGQNTLQATSPDTTLVGDLVLVISWHGTPNASGSLLTLRTGEDWTEVFNFFHNDGSDDGSFAVAWKIATLAGAQVYQAFNTTSPNTDCRTALRIYAVNTFDTSAMPFATPVTFTDGAVAPDPGNISGLNSARDYMVEALGGWWCNNGTVNCIPGAPAGYGNLISTADPGWLELAVTNKAVTGVTSENPGIFTDNVDATNNRGSVSGAIAILGTPGTARRAIVTQGELEVPDPTAPRRTIITQAELEVPNKKFPENLTYIFNRSWNRYKFQSIDPQPVATRRAIVTQVELEVPEIGRRAIITQSELEVPSLPSTLGVGGHFQRPPENVEATWVSNYCNGRTPDVNSDFQHGGPAANQDWSFLTVPNFGNGSWDNWGTWLAARPTRRIDVALGMCPWPTSCTGSSCGTNGQLLASVAAGTHDSKFVAWANWMIGYGLGGSASRPIYVRLGWEMDGKFFPWGCGRGTTAADITLQNNYAAAFRQIVDVLRGVSGTNFKFLWCPNDPPWKSNDTTWLNRVYPGNDHVDLIGMDTYDRNTGHYTLTGTETTTTRTLSWTNYTKVALDNMAAFADPKGKPMAIGECCLFYDAPSQGDGTRNGGGDNPHYIQQMYDWCTTHNVEYFLLFRSSSAAANNGDDLAFYPNALQKWKDTFCTLPHPW